MSKKEFEEFKQNLREVCFHMTDDEAREIVTSEVKDREKDLLNYHQGEFTTEEIIDYLVNIV